MLPDELQQITINSAGIAAGAKEPDAARALIAHMTTLLRSRSTTPRGWGSELAAVIPWRER